MQITTNQIELAYNKLAQANPNVNTVLTIEDINELSQQLSEHEAFDRSQRSAVFILTRLHVLVEGLAPHGITERSAEVMFEPTQNMIDFADNLGIDVEAQISAARTELAQRPKKVKRADALKMMSAHYMSHKDSLPKNISSQRDVIIERIMNGANTTVAFAQ